MQWHYQALAELGGEVPINSPPRLLWAVPPGLGHRKAAAFFAVWAVGGGNPVSQFEEHAVVLRLSSPAPCVSTLWIAVVLWLLSPVPSTLVHTSNLFMDQSVLLHVSWLLSAFCVRLAFCLAVLCRACAAVHPRTRFLVLTDALAASKSCVYLWLAMPCAVLVLHGMAWLLSLVTGKGRLGICQVCQVCRIVAGQASVLATFTCNARCDMGWVKMCRGRTMSSINWA